VSNSLTNEGISAPYDFNDLADFLLTCDRTEEVEALDALIAERNSLRAALTARGELLNRFLDHYPRGISPYLDTVATEARQLLPPRTWP
jgi:hypothetical protein